MLKFLQSLYWLPHYTIKYRGKTLSMFSKIVQFPDNNKNDIDVNSKVEYIFLQISIIQDYHIKIINEADKMPSIAH